MESGDQVWELRDDAPYTTFRSPPTEVLIVATGKHRAGKIYRLEGDPVRPILLARASATTGHRVLQRTIVARIRGGTWRSLLEGVARLVVSRNCSDKGNGI